LSGRFLAVDGNDAMPGQSHEFEITLGNRLECLNDLNAAIETFATAAALTEETEYQLRLLLEELFVNYVSYGRSRISSMRIRLRKRPGELIVETTDDGEPFDPRSRIDPDTNAAIEQRPVGGLGLFFLRELSRELSYRRVDERNIVRFVLVESPENAQRPLEE
jgi:anti-sigma regulatory factor (Ser/Thr protein kinase)